MNTARTTRHSVILRRARPERGFVAIEFVAGIALLLLPVALLVLNFPVWAERQSMGRAAAREAARTYALSSDTAAAQAAVDQIEKNYDVDDGTLTVELGAYPDLPIEPGDTVTATVTVRIPAVNIGLLDISNGEFTIKSTHSEPIDVYRSRAATP